MLKSGYLPFGLHDSHTSGNLSAGFDLLVEWQGTSFGPGFHIQKAEQHS